MTTRIALVNRNGQWEMPGCGCAFHYWDGKPEILTDESNQPPATEDDDVVLDVLRGVVGPHIHPCPQHEKEALAMVFRRAPVWTLAIRWWVGNLHCWADKGTVTDDLSLEVSETCMRRPHPFFIPHRWVPDRAIEVRFPDA